MTKVFTVFSCGHTGWYWAFKPKFDQEYINRECVECSDNSAHVPDGSVRA